MVSRGKPTDKSKGWVESSDRWTYSKHRFLCCELRELGGKLVTPFGGEEAVEEILAFTHKVADAALKHACHAAEGFSHGCGRRSLVLLYRFLIWLGVLDSLQGDLLTAGGE